MDSVHIQLTHDALRAEEAYGFLSGPDAGAVLVFTGTTRRWTGDQETAQLHYEAYEPMALVELQQLGEEASARWPIARCLLVHRLGDVAVGEASVLVGVASGHRAEAFEACRWLIDTLKDRVPIWKRDRAASGAESWVRPRG